jgi:hypothetical protein
MSKPKPKARKKNIKTPFGILDRKVLEDLRGSYDTWALLAAVDAVDQVRYRDDEIREGIQALHGMAMYVINDNFSAGTPGEETIDELADRLAGDILDAIKHLEKAYAVVQPLQFLTGDPDEEYAEWNEWAEEEAA